VEEDSGVVGEKVTGKKRPAKAGLKKQNNAGWLWGRHPTVL